MGEQAIRPAADIELLGDVRSFRVYQVNQASAQYVMNSRTWKRVTRRIRQMVTTGLVELHENGSKYPPYRLTAEGDAVLDGTEGKAA